MIRNNAPVAVYCRSNNELTITCLYDDRSRALGNWSAKSRSVYQTRAKVPTSELEGDRIELKSTWISSCYSLSNTRLVAQRHKYLSEIMKIDFFLLYEQQLRPLNHFSITVVIIVCQSFFFSVSLSTDDRYLYRKLLEKM